MAGFAKTQQKISRFCSVEYEWHRNERKPLENMLGDKRGLNASKRHATLVTKPDEIALTTQRFDTLVSNVFIRSDLMLQPLRLIHSRDRVICAEGGGIQQCCNIRSGMIKTPEDCN